jgi:hypothetical protein
LGLGLSLERFPEIVFGDTLDMSRLEQNVIVPVVQDGDVVFGDTDLLSVVQVVVESVTPPGEDPLWGYSGDWFFRRVLGCDPA